MVENPTPEAPYTPRPAPPGYDITPLPCHWAPGRCMAFYTVAPTPGMDGTLGGGRTIPLGVYGARAEADAGIEEDRAARAPRGGPPAG